jgi:hypothetical protein
MLVVGRREKLMNTFRFRIIDIFVLFTIVSLALGSHIVGFRMSIPRFLTGDFDSYQSNEFVGAKAKPWHQPPPDFSLPEGTGEEYAILRADEIPSPQNVVGRINWLPLLYDILLTATALLLVLCVGRHIRGASHIL